MILNMLTQTTDNRSSCVGVLMTAGLTSWFSIFKKSLYKCTERRVRNQEKDWEVVLNRGSVNDYKWQCATLYPWKSCRDELARSPKPPSVCGPVRSIHHTPALILQPMLIYTVLANTSSAGGELYLQTAAVALGGVPWNGRGKKNLL